MSSRLDHVGIVVSNMGEALKLYRNMLGLTPWDKGIIRAPEHDLQMILLPIGDSFIELIEPIGSESRFAKFLKERGEGLFHLSIFTEDFDAKVRELKEKGFTVQLEEVKAPFPPYTTLRLAWLSPEATRGVWIELIEMATPR